MVRYSLKIEYDGTDFHGWQIQNKDRTVQGEIEAALKELNKGERVVLHGSGRTDSGVHALGQMAHFDLETKLTANTIKNAINAKTSREVIIHTCNKVPTDFHARFHAKKRYYLYKIRCGRTAIQRKYVWQVPVELKSDLLIKCAEMIQGIHNFEGFCRTADEAEHKLCHIYKSAWKIGKKTLIYRICGNRFLHSMVRMLVGTMVEVARHRYQIDDFKELLENRDVDIYPYTAPGKGLYLEKVEY